MTINELDLYKKEKLPERIYHYTSMENFYKIVSGKSLFLFGINNLNDYKERTIVIEAYNEVVLKNESKIPQTYLDVLSNYMEQRYDLITSYVFCMSGLYDSLSQWRAYGDDGNGVCLVFNTAKINIKYSLPSILLSNNEDKLVLHNIIYSKEEQVNIIKKVINIFYHLALKTSKNEEIGRHNFADFAGSYIMRFGSLFKIDKFQEEKEWRLIYSPMIMRTHSTTSEVS